MTTRTRMTKKQLAQEARRRSADVDAARWSLAALAAQAKAEGVPDWAAVIGVECRRAPATVEKWASTWEWCERTGIGMARAALPYSFFECAEKRAATLGDEAVIEMLQEYARDLGRTYESFRAQLSTLAGGGGYGDFPDWIHRERKRVFDWIDRVPTLAAADCLRRAALELANVLAACEVQPQ